MKLDRLASTTQRLSQESIERARHVAGERIRRVDALEGVEGDRQRSLQQEIAEIEPDAIGGFHGSGHVLADARNVAAQVAALGAEADHLIKPESVPTAMRRIDDSV